ncbi:HERV-H LTR-associating protein 1 [Loxodonta africana]|uniref:HERV-H LTR-associating protein 1 n=1 Tax=Loxodonta africana TaxID=9785 RepID=UPI0030CD6E25
MTSHALFSRDLSRISVGCYLASYLRVLVAFFQVGKSIANMLSFLLHGPLVRLCMGLVCLLSLWNTVSGIKGESKKEKGMVFLSTSVPGPRGEEKKEKRVSFLATTELPARSVDLSALNLTELVNGMLSRALRDNRKFFSLLSITSYSSFAFHKLSVAIYNISKLKTMDPSKFPTRYCYCLSNRTNDLSDFSALLVDIIGNSTTYLTEIFKSTSILSVSQTNGSDCIFICVMTGKSGRNLSDFWDMAEKPPVINYTFASSMSDVLGESTRQMAVTSTPVTTSQPRLPSTSSPHHGQSPGVSALRTSPWIETTIPSEGEDTMTTGRLLELPLTATSTWGGSSHTVCLSYLQLTEAGTPRVGSTRLLPLAQIIGEKTPGGPPWKTASPTSPPEVEESRNTRSLAGMTARTVATASSQFQTSSTSDQDEEGLSSEHQEKIVKCNPNFDWTVARVLFSHQTLHEEVQAYLSHLLPGTYTPGTQTPSPTKALAPKYPQTGDLPAVWPFTPGDEPALVPRLHQVSRCPQPLLEGAMTTVPLPLAIQKINPCLMELCRFFQQCLCMSQRKTPRTEAMRYCLDRYSWFLKNATYICQRVKRVSHSHTLRQMCLDNICKSV